MGLASPEFINFYILHLDKSEQRKLFVGKGEHPKLYVDRYYWVASLAFFGTRNCQ